MSTVTFPLRCWLPLQHELIVSNAIISFGDGFEQRATKNLAFVQYSKSGVTAGRADGLGDAYTGGTGQRAYRGINRFGINIRNMTYAGQTAYNDSLSTTTQRANILWRFYQDRNGSFESFFFYNPYENTLDPATDSGLTAGTDTKGRYLVRFQDGSLSKDLFIRFLFNSTINLIEVRE